MRILFVCTILSFCWLISPTVRAGHPAAIGRGNSVAAINMNMRPDTDTSLLPITLVNFSGKQVGHDIQLSWKAVREESTVGYIIERSTDGKYYRKAGTTGPGKEIGMQQYHFTDTAVTALGAPVIFYRLTQLMIEGAQDFSHVLSLSVVYDGFFTKLFPNPAKDQSTVAVNAVAAMKISWFLSDQSGRIVKSSQQQLPEGTSLIPINLNGLAPGLYYLQLQTGTINKQLKLVKL